MLYLFLFLSPRLLSLPLFLSSILSFSRAHTHTHGNQCAWSLLSRGTFRKAKQDWQRLYHLLVLMSTAIFMVEFFNPHLYKQKQVLLLYHYFIDKVRQKKIHLRGPGMPWHCYDVFPFFSLKRCKQNQETVILDEFSCRTSFCRICQIHKLFVVQELKGWTLGNSAQVHISTSR